LYDFASQNKTAELAKTKKTLKYHHQTLSGDETIDTVLARAPHSVSATTLETGRPALYVSGWFAKKC
jgi:hypothetical protein